MTDDFTTEALQYLLNELEPARRAAFEQRLSRDSVAAATFKHCADTYARFALEAAPAEDLSDTERRASLSGILADSAVKSTPRKGVVTPFPRWVWPAAAAFLILLNLIQWTEGTRKVPSAFVNPPSVERNGSANLLSGRTSTRAASASDSTSPDRTGATDAPNSKRSSELKLAAHGDSEPLVALADERVSDELARLDQLRREYALLQRARDSLNAEYNLALQQITKRALTEQGVGRLAAMELVDANSYARGDRKGLMNLARGLLTEPGIVAVEPSTVHPSGDVSLSGPNGMTTSVNITSTGNVLGGSTLSSTGFFSGVISQGNELSIQTKPGLTTDSASTALQPQGSGNTYAWSVFDERENQGYLNLYNLPSVASNQMLQVWIKPVDSLDFRPVGQVPPQFYGQSGSVHYELPRNVSTPAEVMITLESRTATPAKPTGPVVLRGP